MGRKDIRLLARLMLMYYPVTFPSSGTMLGVSSTVTLSTAITNPPLNIRNAKIITLKKHFKSHLDLVSERELEDDDNMEKKGLVHYT